MFGLTRYYQIIIFCRYFRLVFDLIQYWGYLHLSWPTTKNGPAHTSRDITILITTTGQESRLLPALQKWLQVQPARIVVTTVDDMAPGLKASITSLDKDLIRLQTVPFASNREQMIENIKSVATDLLVLTDDRTYPSPNTLAYIAACFSEPVVGGVTVTREIVPDPGKQLSSWEAFGALNQVRRRILHSALAYFNDGQVLNLAGGLTGARTSILQVDSYYSALRDESWLGGHRIITGEDNTCTRFMVQRGWKTRFVGLNDARVFAGVSSDSKYLRQVTRWSRDTARSYLKDLHFAFRSGMRKFYVYAILNILANYTSDVEVILELAFMMASLLPSIIYGNSVTGFAWIVLEHFAVASSMTILEHMPWFTTLDHWVHLPGAILYMYMHAVIVLYSFLTLHKSTWDSRPEMKT